MVGFNMKDKSFWPLSLILESGVSERGQGERSRNRTEAPETWLLGLAFVSILPCDYGQVTCQFSASVSPHIKWGALTRWALKVSFSFYTLGFSFSAPFLFYVHPHFNWAAPITLCLPYGSILRGPRQTPDSLPGFGWKQWARPHMDVLLSES